MDEKMKFTELETAELFLTDRTDLVEQEILHNAVALPAPPDGTGADWVLAFLDRVKANRREQLTCSPVRADLIYYLWFDEQAGQLRFNFINSNHSVLPFRCPLNRVASNRVIVERFLSSIHTDGIPLTEFEESGRETVGFVLDIYVEHIRR